MSCRVEICCPPALDYRADATPCENDDFICAQYPAVCQTETSLILKPSSAWTEILGEVRYEAFLLVDGVEQEIDGDVLYTTNDPAVALVGAHSGNAIGISAGIITITANYGGLQAFAQLEVLPANGCADKPSHFLLLFDISKSSTAGFMGTYPSRLEAAQQFALDFVTHLDTAKDDAAVVKFDTDAALVQDFTSTIATLNAAINGLASTQNNTDLAAGLSLAASTFSDAGYTENRIIVLFTDGENNDGDSPLEAAEMLRALGFIIIIVGLRASGGAFNLLEQMASAGFFINAMPSNAASVVTWLTGLKSYLCSGNCAPPGNVTLGVGQLNFTNFINWDVTANEVDLIGKNPGGIPVYDLLPGNGLYVDDHGSGPGFIGEMQSKTTFNFVPGKTYKLSLYIAGHNRSDTTSRDTRVRLGSILDNTVTRTQAQDFTLEEWTFTVGAPDSGKIIINGVATSGTVSYGNLIDRVLLENVTDMIEMFYDDFDDDNPTEIPPCSNYPYCYTECLDTPIPAQIPDPDTVEPLEGATDGSSVVNCADSAIRVYSRTSANIGDWGDADADVEETAVANLVKSWNPEYITTNGDNWYGNTSTINDWERRAGQYYRDYIHPYNSVNGLLSTAVRNNFYVNIGNHDRDPVGHLPISLSQFNVPPVFFNGAWHAKEYYNVVRGLVEHFFWDSGFDSSQVNQQADGNDVGSTQWEWLVEATSRSTALYKILHMHHAGYTSFATAASQPTLVGDGYLNYTASRNVTDQAKALGIDLVLNGHVHAYERLTVDGLPIITNGLGGRQADLVFGTPRIWSQVRFTGNYGALKLVASPRELVVEFFDIEEILRDSLTIQKF